MLWRGYIIMLLAVIPLASWSYHSLIFNPYMERFVGRAGEFIDSITLPYEIAKLSTKPRDKKLILPVAGVIMSEVANSWGDPRDGGTRTHKGIDIFAKRGTPVYAATKGFVLRTGYNSVGGRYVYTVGAGGVRYYYAHLDRLARNVKVGREVDTETVIGFVGNTGNAINTPPHLHFGMYLPNRNAANPYNLLTNREETFAKLD